ncbi:MAG: 1-(5-phosphoribosyl)-5-[(5-phosphoribosylamino)methylideneamino]imidazole-4-carboxamide isomerase [Anaerolineales bacterium]|nr:1-(5-phosphoribosyl)-5-[(5-phosphoribosylamino)methylideneamino]imidazole-4-carboxamide isomerase [Anaerolineales bacterium]
MIIYPAIDLRAGRVVRLQQGRADAETKYSDDPAQVAARWQSEGAEWLHVVNLDGAFGDDSSANVRELARIVSAISIPVQFGGGLRDLASIEAAFARGIARVVIGTAAIENPQLVSDALARFGKECIAVGIDARDGIVATRGWRAQSHISATDLAKQMRERGVTRIISTDITRDGMLRGVDADAIAELGRAANVRVIASGGVASLRDIETLTTRPEIEGAIVGQALYVGNINLREAIRVASHLVYCQLLTDDWRLC